jgi:hypothetical protein
MKRMLITALVSTGLLVSPACKGDKAADKAAADAGAAKEGDAKEGDAKEGDAKGDEAKVAADAPAAKSPSGSDPKAALALIPEGAFLAVSIDVSGLQKLPVLGGDLVEQAIKDPEDKATYAAMKNCGLTMNLMSRVTMGAEEKAGGLGIIDGKGIAEKGKAQCMAKWLETEKGRKTTFEDGEGFTKMTDDKDGLAYLVGSDRLIFTDKKYGPKVEEMLAGKGAKAVDGSLAGVLAIAQFDSTIWGVLGATDQQLAQMGPNAGPMKKMSGASFSADQSGDGVKFDVRIAMPDEATAGQTKTYLDQKYAEFKPMAGMLGLPPELANKVAIGAEGNAAVMSLGLSAADLAVLKSLAERQAAQMAGAGGPPGMPPGMPPGGGAAPPGM